MNSKSLTQRLNVDNFSSVYSKYINLGTCYILSYFKITWSCKCYKECIVGVVDYAVLYSIDTVHPVLNTMHWDISRLYDCVVISALLNPHRTL